MNFCLFYATVGQSEKLKIFYLDVDAYLFDKFHVIEYARQYMTRQREASM